MTVAVHKLRAKSDDARVHVVGKGKVVATFFGSEAMTRAAAYAVENRLCVAYDDAQWEVRP